MVVIIVVGVVGVVVVVVPERGLLADPPMICTTTPSNTVTPRPV